MDPVRAAAREAAQWAAENSAHLAVLTSDPAPDSPGWALRGFGLTIGDGPPVPLPVAIARWLLADHAGTTVSPADDLSGYDAVLVMGDGSNSRDEKAPGHFDARAVPFDDAVTEALASGNAGFLASLDLGLADDLGAAGAPAWRAIGNAVDEVVGSRLDVASAPYGVLYPVARWSVRWAAPA